MKHFLFAIILGMAGLAVGLFGLEFALRVRSRDFHFTNYVEREWNLVSAGYPVTHDPALGWVTKSNTTIEKDNDGQKVTLLAEGIRSNANTIQLNGKPVLVVGASHAFGNQVSDHDTWPSELERQLNTPVLNGAVFGYGIDQMVLRFEKLAPTIKPQTAILAFHPENIHQCEMSQRYAIKPYFELLNGQLILKNSPVPETKRTLNIFQGTLGYSRVAHAVGIRFFPSLWKESRGEIQAHHQGVAVSCALLQRFVSYSQTQGIRPIILVQHWEDPTPEMISQTREVLACAKKSETFEAYDLRDELVSEKSRNPAYYASLFNFHMTTEGNRFVAAFLSEKLRSHH